MSSERALFLCGIPSACLTLLSLKGPEGLACIHLTISRDPHLRKLIWRARYLTNDTPNTPTYSKSPGKIWYELEKSGNLDPELLFIVPSRLFILYELPSGRRELLCTHTARARLDINRARSWHVEAALLSRPAPRLDVQLLVYGRL